jgi:preprotein translocase subunit SecY
MASAVEQLAANLSWSSLAKAEDLKKRIWFTLAALVVYRLGTYIPVPGVDPAELARLVQQNSSGILGWINGLAGGALGAWPSLRSTSCPTSRLRSSFS